MSQSFSDDARTQIRVRLPNDLIASLDHLVSIGEFRSRSHAAEVAASHLVNLQTASASPDFASAIGALEQGQNLNLFIALILVSRVMSEGERDHICSIAEASAETGFPLAKTFIEMMQLDRPLEARAAE
jgi:hypothetical protein